MTAGDELAAMTVQRLRPGPGPGWGGMLQLALALALAQGHDHRLDRPCWVGDLVQVLAPGGEEDDG